MTTHNHPQNEGNDPATIRHMKRIHYWDAQRLQKLGEPTVEWDDIPEEGMKTLFNFATTIKDFLDTAEGDKYIAMMAFAGHLADEDNVISPRFTREEAAIVAGQTVTYYLRPTPHETTEEADNE